MPYPEDILKSLNISLPKAPEGVGNYAAWIKADNMIYTSGQLPWVEKKMAYTGRLGKERTIEEGYDCARICSLNAVAQLKNAVGDLSKIEQIIRIDGHILCYENFTDHSSVLNGASDLFNQVFGKQGLHTRSALGMYQSPLNASVLIYVIAKFKQ